MKNQSSIIVYLTQNELAVKKLSNEKLSKVSIDTKPFDVRTRVKLMNIKNQKNKNKSLKHTTAYVIVLRRGYLQ